jgi:hypothetical protein
MIDGDAEVTVNTKYLAPAGTEARMSLFLDEPDVERLSGYVLASKQLEFCRMLNPPTSQGEKR